MFTTLIILVALPTFVGALLWLTSRLEERVAEPPAVPTLEAVPAEPPGATTPHAA
jgi:hypothetical protein